MLRLRVQQAIERNEVASAHERGQIVAPAACRRGGESLYVCMHMIVCVCVCVCICECASLTD